MKAQKSLLNDLQVKLKCDLKSIDYENCNCLPPCDEIHYDFEIIQNEYEPKHESHGLILKLDFN